MALVSLLPDDRLAIARRAIPIDYSRSKPHEGIRRRAAFGSTRSLVGRPDGFVRGHRPLDSRQPARLDDLGLRRHQPRGAQRVVRRCDHGLGLRNLRTYSMRSGSLRRSLLSRSMPMCSILQPPRDPVSATLERPATSSFLIKRSAPRISPCQERGQRRDSRCKMSAAPTPRSRSSTSYSTFTLRQSDRILMTPRRSSDKHAEAVSKRQSMMTFSLS